MRASERYTQLQHRSDAASARTVAHGDGGERPWVPAEHRSARDRVTSAGRVAWAVEMSSNAQLNPAAVTWEPSQAPQGRTLPLKMRVSAGRTLCGRAKESTCGSGAACDTGRQADMPALRGCGVGDALRAEETPD